MSFTFHTQLGLMIYYKHKIHLVTRTVNSIDCGDNYTALEAAVPASVDDRALIVRIRSVCDGGGRDAREPPTGARTPALRASSGAQPQSHLPEMSAIDARTTAPSNILVRFESLHCQLPRVGILLALIRASRNYCFH